MSKWKDIAIQKYKEECFKQTRPYQYEIAYLDEAGGRPEGTPPISATGTIIFFPDDSGNILNFEGINTDYLIFVSKYGVMEKNAIDEILAKGMGADIIYCDEDFTENVDADLSDMNVRIRNLRTPWRKPEYSPDTLLSFPYIETCFAIRTSFARMVPAIKQSPELGDNIRMWDFLLRATERTNRIVHIPEVLFHRDLNALIPREKDEHITDSQIYEALFERYKRPGYQLCREAAQNRRNYGLVIDEFLENQGKDEPLVSIIIPTKDHPELIQSCIRNIRINAGSIPYEVIVIDNGSNESNKKEIESEIGRFPSRMRYIYDEYDFDFSKMCNIGASEAKAPYLLFLNDDVDATCEQFLEKLLLYATIPYIGAVGAKLLYPEGRKIQHVGVTDIDRGPTHKLVTLSDDEIHYYGRNHHVWDVLAVTGACLMVAREKYFQVGGFSDKMKIGYNDIDLCVKLFENGYFNVVNNECVLIHKESVSRGNDGSSESASERLRTEREAFYEAHSWLKESVDPFYGPKLDRDTISYRPRTVADYQKTDLRNKCKELTRLPARPSDKVRFNIDRCGFERAISRAVPDAYVFDGWALMEKLDNALIKKYMVFVPILETGELRKDCIIAAVSPKYRTDIKEVFPEAVNVNLAGFECRVPVDIFEENTQYRMGVCVRKLNRTRGYKLTLGDIYEPGRGIITEEQLL